MDGLVTLLNFADDSNILQVSLALFSGAFTIIVAWVAFRGKSDETFANHTRSLVQGQAQRVEILENRLDTVTDRLFSTQRDLHSEIARSSALIDALDLAVYYLNSVEDMIEGRTTNVPDLSRLNELRQILDEHLSHE